MHCLHETVFWLNDILRCLVHAHLTTFCSVFASVRLSVSLSHANSSTNYSSPMSMAFCVHGRVRSMRAALGIGVDVAVAVAVCICRILYFATHKGQLMITS